MCSQLSSNSVALIATQPQSAKPEAKKSGRNFRNPSQLSSQAFFRDRIPARLPAKERNQKLNRRLIKARPRSVRGDCIERQSISGWQRWQCSEDDDKAQDDRDRERCREHETRSPWRSRTRLMRVFDARLASLCVHVWPWLRRQLAGGLTAGFRLLDGVSRRVDPMPANSM